MWYGSTEISKIILRVQKKKRIKRTQKRRRKTLSTHTNTHLATPSYLVG
jgi:hypothetical protein